MAISPQRVIRFTSSSVYRVGPWGFLGLRIEWRYSRFDQIQNDGHDMTWHDRKYRQEPSDVAFHFGDRHLGFLADDESMSHDRPTGIGAIKNFDCKNVGIAVGILLLGLCHCALEVQICLESNIFTSQLPANVVKNCGRDKGFTICQFSYCLQPKRCVC